MLPFDRREPGAAPLPPAEVRSNRAIAEGRVYLLLLDDLFVMASRTPVVQQVARDFIGRYVQPGDLVAVTTTGGMAGTSQAFTEDMRLVGRAVDRFVGKKVRSAAVEKLEQAYRAREMDPMRTRRTGNANTPLNRDGAVLGVNAIDDEVLDRGRLALRTVKNAVQSMAGVAGRRKTVVYVSEGVDIPLGPGDSTEIAREVQAIIGQAARANVAVYALSPRGLHGMGDEMSEMRALPTGQTGPIGANYTLTDIQKEQRIADIMLRTVAEGTGGIAMVDANQLTTALDRIVAESSHYYLLGYTPPNPKRDGKYRAIDIAVRKPGLHAIARKGYTAPDDREARPEPLKGLPPELGTLLRQPLPAAGLPLAAHAVAFPAPTDNVSVTVEIGPGALAFTPKGDKRFNALDVAILPVDAAGRTHGLTQGHPQLTLPPAVADTVTAKGLRLSHRLTLAPGEYQLRIGVRESGGGAAGSVLCDVVVPDPAVPGLAMTPIVVSTSSAITVPSAYNDPGLLWALGGPPTTARGFAGSDTLSAYVELDRRRRRRHPRHRPPHRGPRRARPRRRPQPAAEGQRPGGRGPQLRLRCRSAAEGARARPLRAPHRSPCQRAGGAAGARADVRREEPGPMKRLVLSIVLAGLPFASVAQRPAPAPVPPPVPQAPTLRASVDQVVVDVVVTDADGKVVTGLTAADFEVRERGTLQTVATFNEVLAAADASADRPLRSPLPATSARTPRTRAGSSSSSSTTPRRRRADAAGARAARVPAPPRPARRPRGRRHHDRPRRDPAGVDRRSGPRRRRDPGVRRARRRHDAWSRRAGAAPAATTTGWRHGRRRAFRGRGSTRTCRRARRPRPPHLRTLRRTRRRAGQRARPAQDRDLLQQGIAIPPRDDRG